MKFINIVKLLSVLLCIFMLFVACDSTETDGTEVTTAETEANTEISTETDVDTDTDTEAPETDEPLLENVEGKFENFFEIVEVETGELSGVERVEGTVLPGSTDDLFIVYSTDIDLENNVTDKYDVYNAVTGEIVLTLENTYFNGNYDNFDENDLRVFENTVLVNNGDGTFSPVTYQDKVYPERMLYVSVHSDDAKYIEVLNVDVTPIDEDVREENGCVYEIATTYTYYDVYGNLIATANRALDVESVRYGNSSEQIYSVAFGATVAHFDSETDELVKVSSLDSDHISEAFVYENDRYGYYNVQSTNISSLGYVRYMDILNKGTGEVLRYHFDNAYQQVTWFYLHNGDVFIQYMNLREEDEPYDFRLVAFGVKIFGEVKQVILSVDDGKETVLEGPEYIVVDMKTGEEFAESAMLGEGFNIAVTENARNVAEVMFVENKELQYVPNIVVFDNDMSLLYTYERIIPEHNPSEALGYKILPNGDLLVTLDGLVANKAIVKADGTVRAYLKDDMQVIGEYVVDNKNVYDYDLNVLYNYSEDEYTLETGFENLYKFLDAPLFYTSRTTDIYATERRMYFLFDSDETGFFTKQLIPGEAQIVEVNEDYLVVYLYNEERYVLYNESMTAILKTKGYMNITAMADGYLVQTNVADETVLYVVK